METKSILQSKTIWGIAIAALPTLLSLFGLSVTDVAAFSAGATEIVDALITLAGSAVAVWGRIAATKNLVVKKP